MRANDGKQKVEINRNNKLTTQKQKMLTFKKRFGVEIMGFLMKNVL